MNHPRPGFVFAFVLTCVLALFTATAEAQTGPTRPTACSPTTAWDAVCVTLVAPTQYTDGTTFPAGTVVNYRVEDKVGSGNFATVPHTGTAATGLLVSSLPAGSHLLRVYAVVNAVESSPSNTTTKGVTTGVPNAPVITIALTIKPGSAPVVIEVNGQPVYPKTASRR